uniref:BZIP domain-containing protein n=1 Tax=Fusarium oxysporum (strain Fo5176) TaxID=660025 RepID=A0A0D2YD38_FUSOF
MARKDHSRSPKRLLVSITYSTLWSHNYWLQGVMVIILQQLVHLNPRHQTRQLAQSQDLFLAQKLSHQPNLRQFLFQSLHGFSSTKRPFEDITPEDTRTQYPHLHPLTGAPTGPPSTMSDHRRLHSKQPIASPGTQAPLSTFPPSHAPGRTQPPLVHSQTSYSPNMQAGRPFPSPGPPSESASPWSETLRRHGMGGSLFGVEGQQALLALPGSEAPIPVHMDFSQASKKADEKRQRNAVASTRHRRKKKIMQEENSKQLQELRDERRLMEIRIEELIQQRDFYREDRNRLRDIVAQTPSISGLAAGPPNQPNAVEPMTILNIPYHHTGPMRAGTLAHPPSQGFKNRIREPVSGFPFSLEFQRLGGQQGTLTVGLDLMEFVCGFQCDTGKEASVLSAFRIPE